MATMLSTSSIGPYQLIRPLGAGGMGEVWLAHDPKLGRNIALKLLPSHLSHDEVQLERLRQEARSASSLNHPNILTIYDVGEEAGSAYIAMEYVEGRTLRELLTPGEVPVRKALQIAAQIADGLAAAHKRSLIHRDLKPENIMVTSDGVVKILDWGLAKPVTNNGADAFQSDPGTIVGTYAYMAPEQARGFGIDYRADQFALGAILYELVTGKRAFEAPTTVETLFMVVREEPTSLSSLAPHVPAPYRWIVERCLSKEAEDRYVSTLDLARELRHLRDHLSEAGAAAVVVEKSAPQRRNLTVPIAAALLLATIAAVVTFFATRPAPRPLRSERYLTYSGTDFSPAVSPDGKLIAFSSLRDGKQKIWLRQADSGSEIALTEGQDDFPRFSPDGTSILFARFKPGEPGELWRVPSVGGEARRLVTNAASADWSPDGKRLAFVRNKTENGKVIGELYVANADGTNPQKITDSESSGFGHPRWSPDATKIAMVGARARATQSIYVADVAAKTSRLLSGPANGGEVSSVVWSRDSRHLTYLRAQSVEAVVGSSALIVRHDIAKDRYETVGWSSHNAAMIDVAAKNQLVLDVRSPRDNLRSITVDGGGEKWVTRGNSSDRQPVYSPDGRSVLFSSNRSGNLDLWQIALDGGTVRRITDDAAEDWDPAFTADGKHIVWSSGRSGNLEIWAANVDGTEARQVSRDGFDAENPTVTPDGRYIVYNSFNPKNPGVWRVNFDGSNPKLLVAGRTALPEVSPDGKFVAYIANSRTAQTALRVVSIDGKDAGFNAELRNLRRTNAIMGRVRWLPDAHTLAFLGQNEEGVNGIFAQDFIPGRDTSRTKRPLTGFDADRSTESFGLSPDGKTVTVAGWEQLFSILLVDGVEGIERAQVAAR